MKNIVLAVVVAMGLTTMVSCKKDYNCECQKIYTGTGGSTTVNDGIYTYKDSRTRAEDRCNAEEKTGTDLGGDYSRECQIK
ncbi:MAG: hypothetical protein V4608_12230 [Bacteroidota bacterium]